MSKQETVASDTSATGDEEKTVARWFPWEVGPGYKSGYGDFLGLISLASVVTGFIPVTVLVFSVGAVFIQLLSQTDLSSPQMVSWISVVYIFGGINSLILAPYWKQPIVGAWSIPGMFLVIEALEVVSYKEAVGAFLLSGVIVFLLGITGTIRRVLRLIPPPVLTAMVAGVLLSFPLRIIEGFEASLIIGLAGVGGYLVFNAIPRMPGILGTIVFGSIAGLLAREFGGTALEFELARFIVPGYAFSLQAFLSIAIPLSILVVGAENMQATGVLRSLGFRPPVNAMTIVSGLAGMATSIFGGHDANIAGPTTATAASPDAGPLDGRYTAAILAGIVFIAYGILSPVMIQLTQLIPESLSAVLVGIVILPVVGRALSSTFTFKQGRFLLGAMTSLIVATSGLTLFGISSPFWALVFGALVSAMAETRDYLSFVKDSDVG